MDTVWLWRPSAACTSLVSQYLERACQRHARTDVDRDAGWLHFVSPGAERVAAHDMLWRCASVIGAPHGGWRDEQHYRLAYDMKDLDDERHACERV